MHIAFFSDNFYPELSGIADSIIISGTELKKRGHEVCYIGPYYSPKDYEVGKRLQPKDKESDTVNGIPVVRIPSLPMPFSPTGQARFALPLLRISRAFLKAFRPDVIHSNSPYGVGWEALNAAKHFSVPLVGTNHTAIEDFFPLPFLVRSYDAWYYNHCDYVTTPYAGLIARMREKGFYCSSRVVANPVELTTFEPVVDEEKSRLKQSLNITGPVILYVGRLGVEKKVDVILATMALLVKKFPALVFIATGHGAAEADLRVRAQKYGIGCNVRFVGFVSHSELQHYYQIADVFAMMSTSDSQSIALMQSYSSGVPAVCARSHGLPDYTPSDCGFLVEPGDHKTLAEKLLLLLTDESLRKRMGETARIYVRQFAPNIIAEKWEQIYQNVIERSKNKLQ